MLPSLYGAKALYCLDVAVDYGFMLPSLYGAKALYCIDVAVD